MQKNLVIVESPAKAKTIGGFLGPDFEVKSSMGHIRDLKKKGLGVDVDNNFAPDYEISEDKQKLVSELKSAAKKAEVVWLASDEDREGEAIAWHLYNVLKLKPENSHRIVFHEITKTAIQNAVANPRTIDINLVNAQQARRVLDRLVGFELSPVLWRKIKPSLSAGRVQSVTVRLIVEREREIKAFKSERYFKVSALFKVVDVNGKSSLLKTELNHNLKDKDEALTFVQKCREAAFSVADIQAKSLTRRPAAPFTTSTLQQEAARKLGFSVSKTMLVAQHLYEAGKITYMRTDSVNLSQLAIGACKKQIEENYGAEYLNSHNYHTNTKGAQEAHEAIRPTYIDRQEIDGDSDEKRLYSLIWKRTIASQMVDAQIESTTLSIGMSNDSRCFCATGEVIKFDGFLKVYRESVDDEEDQNNGILPQLKKGQKIDSPESVDVLARLSKAPYRYTEASLVKQLEALGIGRPSTYASTISTIQNREYVEKGDVAGENVDFDMIQLRGGEIKQTVVSEVYGAEHGKLIPTDLGTVVNDFLLENFPDIMNIDFTAQEEKDFDRVADGELEWTELMAKFYKDFHPQVEKVDKLQGPKVGERNIGVDPVSGKPVFVKIGRFGPIAQIGSADDKNEKPRFASLRKNQHLETITLEEALDLFKLPREIGEYEGVVMTVAVGRFGPYIKHGSSFYTIPKTEDVMTIEAETAIKIIEEKREAEKNKIIKEFESEGIKVCNGRFGPYITKDKVNYKIPKGTDAKELSLDDCLKIISDQAEKPAKKTTRRYSSKASKA